MRRARSRGARRLLPAFCAKHVIRWVWRGSCPSDWRADDLLLSSLKASIAARWMGSYRLDNLPVLFWPRCHFFLPDIPIGAPLVMNSAWATTNGGPREISGHQTLDLPRRPEDKREPGGRVLEGTEGDRREPSFDLVRPYRQHRRQP